MRSLLLSAAIAGTAGSLVVLWYAVRSIAADHGLLAAYIAAACVVAACVTIGALVDRRRSGAVRLLEQLEREHGLDLEDAKKRARDI